MNERQLLDVCDLCHRPIAPKHKPYECTTGSMSSLYHRECYEYTHTHILISKPAKRVLK